MEIIDFIAKAKKTTYASGKSPRKLEDGSEEFTYEEGEYRYRDRYYAKDPKPFGGEEIVWQNGVAVWVMNYYGFVLDSSIESAVIYQFLRKAMALVSKENPFRGPPLLRDGDLEYKNQTQGNIKRFNGTEKIILNGKEIYRLDYSGGEL